jgi:hypothetical protein
MEIKLIIEDEINFKQFRNTYMKKCIEKNISEFKKHLLKDPLPKYIEKKLTNYLSKFNIKKSLNHFIKELIKDINNNGIFFYTFIKDPSKQNSNEKCQYNFINHYGVPIKKCKDDIRLHEGKFIINKEMKLKTTKSMDFMDEINGKTIYINMKYTNELGGSQQNVAKELIKFIEESQLILRNEKYKNKYIFICICDGKYYTKSVIKELNSNIKEQYKDCIKIFNSKEYILFRT